MGRLLKYFFISLFVLVLLVELRLVSCLILFLPWKLIERIDICNVESWTVGSCLMIGLTNFTLVWKGGKIEVFPFLVEMDRYKMAA